MRVTQVIATFAPIGLVAAGPLHGHSRHTHLHHLHHRSLINGTLSNSTTTDAANSTIYADHISYETSTVNVAANFADGTDANSASSEVASNTISSTTAQSETAFPTVSFTSDGSYASGSPSNSSLALNISTAIPSDASVSVVLAVAATTPAAVGALSQTVDTTTSISVDTVYNTITVNGAVTTASASEKTVTVTDVVTNYVTATFSALTPFKAPVIKVAALSSGSSCAAIKTSIVYLPASQSPTLVAGGVSASKVSSSSSSKATTVRYVSHSSSKSSSSSVKKSSTSSKKTSTSSKKTSTSAAIPVTKIASTSTKKSSTSSKKTSSSSAKKVSSTSSSKKITSTSSTKKASTSSVKPTSSSKKSSTMITMSSMIQHGATTKTIVTTSSIPALVSGSSYKASSSAKSSSSKAAASSSAKASSSSCATVAAPASTQTGIVSGCTKWYTAKSGDYCYVIAAANGISTDTFMSWNPAVNAPSCNNIQVGYAYCVATCSSGSSSGSSTPSSAAASSVAATSPAASTATTATQTSASGSSSSSTSVASTAYKMYTGNGTVAAGWPSQSQWMDFDDMFTANIPIMQQSCANNGWGANNSPTEIADIKAAITKVSAASGVDPRFILAIVMQESNGCVRVVTTSWSVQNPGLMQDHAGTGTCNSGGVIQDPCPASEIEQMIVDGTEGTASGDGLVQCLKETDVTDVSMYYRAARIYNGGLGGYHADDLGTGCCTLCYASDVANRLTGWSSGLSGCTL
ncbi:carbohydrate-binding module family 50 protein, partial [Aureobasidium melanogenum]